MIDVHVRSMGNWACNDVHSDTIQSYRARS